MEEWKRLNQEIVELIKEDLLKEFDWLEYHEAGDTIDYNDRIVVDMYDLDVNYDHWHDDRLTGHEPFIFDGGSDVYLTEHNYETFKERLRDYESDYIKTGEDARSMFEEYTSSLKSLRNERNKLQAREKEIIDKYRNMMKEDLLNEFKWLRFANNGLYYGRHEVIDLFTFDVGFEYWHNGVLEGHETFGFKESSCAYLDETNYEEFKQVLKDYEEKYIVVVENNE